MDGSTLRVSYTEKNVEAYPQYQNQHGKAHFPLLRVEVATNAETGVMIRPAYGPYNGKDAVGEIRLAEELCARIPKGAIVIGDRLCGCCRFAATAQRAGHEVIVRVKEVNAKKFIGVLEEEDGEVAAEWKSDRARDGSSYTVNGRFIWRSIRRKGFRPYRLVLFTTAALPREVIVAQYELRWNVELDVRDIKSTLGMDMLYSKTPAMGKKEIILGFVAYNLIRHIAVVSAKTLKVSPRQLSFSRILKRMHAIGSVVYASGSSAQAHKALTYLLCDLASLRLPKRKKELAHEPRKVWQKGQKCFMTRSREEERNALLSHHDKELGVK